MTQQTFEFQPTLRGIRIQLSPLRAEDFDSLYALAKDPLVWEQHPDPQRFQREKFAAFFKNAVANTGSLLISMRDGTVVGTSRFYDYDATLRQVVIGYTFLGLQFWGDGSNSETKRLMLDHAFQWVQRVHFHIGGTNYRSQRAVGKLGAVRIGETILNDQPRWVYEINSQNSQKTTLQSDEQLAQKANQKIKLNSAETTD